MNYKLLIKLTISICLLVLLVRSVEVDDFTAIVSTLSPSMVALVVAGYILGQLISVVKWWLIVTSQGVSKLSFIKAFHAYFSGMFVNVLGVGTVGGDLTRAILISDNELTKTRCLSSVFADRAHGLVVLSLIGTISVAVFGGTNLPDQLWFILAAGGLGVAVAWFVGPSTLTRIIPAGNAFSAKAEQFAAAFPQSLPRVVLITALSVAFHLLQVGLHLLMAMSLGLDVSLTTLLVSIPFVNILSSLPISWQGLGVRENAYAFFLVPGIMSSEQALAMGAIWLFAVTIAGLAGGLVSLMPLGSAKSSAAIDAFRDKTDITQNAA